MTSVSMRGCLVILLVFIAVGGCVSFSKLVRKEWKTFKLEFNKSYTSKREEIFRLKVFKQNKDFIDRHNALHRKGVVPFQLGLNSYADMLHHEFVKTMNGFNNTLYKLMMKRREFPTHLVLADAKVDPEVDWRKKGAVTPVKNQGPCGSCWAFSATGALEGQHFRKTGKLVSLSAQNLIDCSYRYGNNGCRGGFAGKAFMYIEDHGIDTEEAYPYEAGDMENCRYTYPAKDVRVRGIHVILEGDEEALQHAVATLGPVAVSIDASQPSFQLFRKGVYHQEHCFSKHTNHAVLVVGYGTTEQGEDYWLVKNSWGPGWGEEGYFKMARNVRSICNIALAAIYPVV